jgi:ubiquitin carboxyl-terminal hydrolase 9/13
MSLRGKPKFWPSGKDKDKHDSTIEDINHMDGEDKGEEKERDAKNRFSLGRKKSTFKF